MDASARNRRQLMHGAQIWWFPWAPDSKEIAVADDRGLEVVDVVTASVRLLSQKEAFGPPLWSPDGQTILFQPLGGDLTLISLSDGRSRQITGTRLAHTYAWAPRGRTIAYVVRDDIFLVEADGGTPEPVASSEAPDDIAWSPDGTRIGSAARRPHPHQTHQRTRVRRCAVVVA